MLVDRSLLSNYVDAVRQHNRQVDGLVGLTQLEEDSRICTTACHIWGLPTVWHFAKTCKTAVPWGVTANLMLRWTPELAFDMRFPRAGGGEDVDICIVAGSPSGSFRPVPSASATHPWWGNGSPLVLMYRFARFGKGDGQLIDKYPKHVYRTMLNFPELVTLLLVTTLILNLYGCYHAAISVVLTIFNLAVMEMVVGTLCHLLFVAEECPNVQGWKRVIACALATVYRVSNQVGRKHVNCIAFKLTTVLQTGQWWGHCVRLRFWNLGTRFDWWLGLPEFPNVRASVALRHQIHMCAYTICLVGMAVTLCRQSDRRRRFPADD